MTRRRKRVLIMGAAGRDFHNFNVCYRHDKSVEVVCFTAAQIPDIAGRKYPSALAGPLYPKGIPIHDAEKMLALISRHEIDEVVLSYSDLEYRDLMHAASAVIAAGASFTMLGTKATMLKSRKPVVAVCAVRTGCGKSQTTRKVCDLLKERGLSVAVVRHPMPYGDLAKQACQRFASIADLRKHKCTIEEMEEYEPHIERGQVVYAGVDYEMILRAAEKEADVIIWDGGNNDLPFYRPDLFITIADPHRPGHEIGYYPGESNLAAADVVVINKVDTAKSKDVRTVRENTEKVNPRAMIIEAASPIRADAPEAIRGKRVLVIEDGPTTTHGEMKYGAGMVAAKKFGAREVVDPRPFLKGKLKETFAKYPGIGPLLPAMGYGPKQVKDLEATIAAVRCDSVIIATPIDLRRVVKIAQPTARITYELQEIGRPNLKTVLDRFLPKARRQGTRRTQRT
jgi:predicted GTPase